MINNSICTGRGGTRCLGPGPLPPPPRPQRSPSAPRWLSSRAQSALKHLVSFKWSFAKFFANWKIIFLFDLLSKLIAYYSCFNMLKMFNNDEVPQVFTSSARVSVYTEPLDTWVLRLESVSRGDGGTYDCHLNNNITSGPLKLSVLLTVRGQL